MNKTAKVVDCNNSEVGEFFYFLAGGDKERYIKSKI